MTRITIQQFRAVLAGHADANAAVRAYRDLARRPEVAGGMARNDWLIWTGAPVSAYREITRRPELAAGMHAREWVTWPPAATLQANA